MKHFSLQSFTAQAPRKTAAGSRSYWHYPIALCLLFFLALMSNTAMASHHFKGGHVSYTYAGGGKYNILIKGYWNKDKVGSIMLRYEGRPKIDNSPQTVSKTLMPDGETVEHVQKQTVTWSKPGTYFGYWRTCCWEDGSNFGDINQSVFLRINYDTEAPSSSPQFQDLPYFNFNANQPISYRLGMMEDPDGHEQEFSLEAPYNHTNGIYQEMLQSGFQLKKDGTIQWDNPLAGEWLLHVRVSEKINGQLTGAYISWEIILNVHGSNSKQAPSFGPLEPKTARAGETLTFEVEATDAASLTANGSTLEKGATFTQTASGSVAKGTYSWTVPQNAAGTYNVQFLAVDSQDPSLISQTKVVINVVTCNEFTANYTLQAQPCAGSSNGKLSLGGTEEGYSPYEYSLDNGVTYQSAADFENLAPGTYTGIIRDAAGCTSNSVAITLEEAPLPEVSLSLPATVCADADAIALSGGSPAGGVYQGAGVENGFFYPERAGAGTHNIRYTFTNSNGCSNTASAALTVNEALIADAGDDALVYANNGSGAQNGGGIGYGAGNGNEKGQGAYNGAGHERRCATLTAGASGGTSPYTYKWSTGETAQSITVCPSQTTTYQLTVTDALGCTATSQTQVVVEDMQTNTDANPSGNSTASADTKALISAYPNPLTETSQLKINLPEADQITVEITDMSGNVVKKLYTGPIAAKQTLSFPLNSKLGNGKVYIARVKGAKGVHHCRLTLK